MDDEPAGRYGQTGRPKVRWIVESLTGHGSESTLAGHSSFPIRLNFALYSVQSASEWENRGIPATNRSPRRDANIRLIRKARFFARRENKNLVHGSIPPDCNHVRSAVKKVKGFPRLARGNQIDACCVFYSCSVPSPLEYSRREWNQPRC